WIGYGSLLFLEPMLSFMSRISTVPISQKAATNDWVWAASWVMPAPLALAAWLLAGVGRRGPRGAAAGEGGVARCVLRPGRPFAALVYWECRGIPWIQVDYYGTTLLPVSFLLLGAALGPALQRLRPAAFAVALGLALAALMIPLRDTLWPRVWQYAYLVP